MSDLNKLTQKRLKELLSYDPETGFFVRLKSIGGIRKGSIAGNISHQGYRRITIDGNRYNASRLAWLYRKGYFPENQIDHINRIKHDDRWKNLRHVSQQCNLRNCDAQKNNKSGIIGVHWRKDRRKWVAQIKVSGKVFYLGAFLNKISAAKARWQAEVKYNFPSCNTTSTSYLYIKGKGH